MNYDVAEIIRSQRCLRVQEVITYEAILHVKDEAYFEHVVRDKISKQLANHIYKNLTLTTTDTHEGRTFQQETYFFTRTQLLQLAQQCYDKGTYSKN